MLTFIDFFAGIGGFHSGFEKAGMKCIGWCEFNKYAQRSYRALYNTEGLWFANDVQKVRGDKIPKADIWTFGFPCFIGYTVINTNTGYKQIKDVEEGNLVLTHKNRYRKVLKTMQRETKETYHIKASGIEEIVTTSEHPFYVVSKDNINKEPVWVKAKELSTNYYLLTPVNNNCQEIKWEGVSGDGKHSNLLLNKLPLNDDRFYWFLGRWLGDGWTNILNRPLPRKDKVYKTILSVGKSDINKVTDMLGNLFPYTLVEERTVYKLIFSNKELTMFLRRYGHGAENKFIHQEILNLPKEKLRLVIEGYISADGCFTENSYKITTVSRKLAYGIRACINKIYEVPCYIYKNNRLKTHIIEGRLINQKPFYQLVFRENIKRRKSFYKDGFIYTPINSINIKEETLKVYNLSVEEDESYEANGVICHNCQDVSIAGKQAGIKRGTRSGLFYEIMRLLDEAGGNRPKWLIAENVKNLLSIDDGWGFYQVLSEMAARGYSLEWRVYNSKAYGVPQSRERVYIAGYNGEHKGQSLLPVTRKSERTLKEIINGSQGDRVYNLDLACTITSQGGGIGAKTGLYCQFIDLSEKEVKLTEYARCLTTGCNKGTSNHKGEISGVLLSNGVKCFIRKLTPKECWRLQGFTDEQFHKALLCNSTEQLYKQAGNAVTVNVVYDIGKHIVEFEKGEIKT